MGQRRIIVAQHAGFCFGVDRAVSMIDQALDTHDHVYALGPVVHNDAVNDRLCQRGMILEENLDQIPEKELVILRAHGVPKSTYDYLNQKGMEYVDVACPFVLRIHKIVSGLDPEKDVLILAGKEGHAETIGIMGHAFCEKYLVSSEEELDLLLEEKSEQLNTKNVVMVSQTTFRMSAWENCKRKLKSMCTNAKIFDTICKATEERQKEAEVLSNSCDKMIVIGAKHSSNTIKLYDVCRNNCETCLLESVNDFNPAFLEGANTIGVTAGASTPAAIIKEVLEAMSEVVNNNVEIEEDFAAMLEESFQNDNSTDQKAKGVVIGITPTEIQVDIGRKQTGYISYEEYSYNPAANPAEELKVGDEIDCIIMKTNDVEGTIMLSKRRFDSANAWSEMEAALEDGTVVEGVVTDINKGGIIATTEKGIRVFIPGSLATESRGADLSAMKGQTVSFKIIEVNKQRRRAVGNIKVLLRESRKAAQEAFWANAEEGQVYTGVVKSFTPYGAFVDIGGVDGMIHISELSWKRIKQPSDVLSLGDTVEVYIKSLENNRISLGYKKEEDNPWVVLKNTYDVGDVVDATIVGTTKFGAFANIIPEIDGLIHISQIANERIEKPEDVLTVGETVKAKITDIDYDKKRVSLSIRALLNEDADEEEAVEE